MPDPALALAAVLTAAADGGSKSVDQWAHDMLDALKLSISMPSPPRSNPWDPPGMETGYLWRSYEVHIDDVFGETVATLSTSAFYAHYLEFGTSKMQPRPHFRPAVAAARPLLPPTVTKGVLSAEKQKAREYGGSG
jgi:HK97 gp10 family phage protein